MTKNIKAQFKSGWLRACERYTQGEATEQIKSALIEACPSAFFDGLCAACEAIMDPAMGRNECLKYGFTGTEIEALLAVTLDV